MSTTSPNFSLVIATTSDTVNVVSQIANNFTSLDSILGIVHTGSGQLKAGLAYTNPTLVNPVLSGTMTGGNIIATTASFNTITASGGSLTVNSLTVGTYSMPATIGASGEVLGVQTGNVVFFTNTPGTGASEALDNLASVAINTSLGTFSAGKVTVASITGTAGILSGLTSIAATTGTMGVNFTVLGTLNAGAVNCTGGSITAAGLSIGTYSYPATVGSAGQFLYVSSGNLIFNSGSAVNRSPVVFEWHGNPGAATSGEGIVQHGDEFFEASQASTASGTHLFYVAYNHTATAGIQAFSSVFYKQPNVNTLSFDFKAYCVGFTPNSTATGFMLVTVGTATGSATITGTTTTPAAFVSTSVLVDVSALATNTVYDLGICLGAQNSSNPVAFARMFVADIIGYIIT